MSVSHKYICLGVFALIQWALSFSEFEFSQSYFYLVHAGLLYFLIWNLRSLKIKETAFVELNKFEGPFSGQSVWWLFLMGNLLMLAIDPGVKLADNVKLLVFMRGLTVLVFVLGLWSLKSHRDARKSERFLILVFAMLILAKMMIPWISENPLIDVYHWSREATEALLRGENPYLHQYSDQGTEVYGYGPVFPYLPGLLLIYSPFVKLGIDIRYASILADLGVSFIFYWFCRRRGADKINSLLVALSYYSLPISVRVIEMAWIDTFLVFFLCGGFLAIYTRRWLTAGFLLGVALTIKQYAIMAGSFGALLLWFELDHDKPSGITERWRMSLWKIRKMLLLVIVPLVIILPFLVANPAQFIHSTVEVLHNLPLRSDSMGWQSYLKAWGVLRGPEAKKIEWLFLLIWWIGLGLFYRKGPETSAGLQRLRLMVSLLSSFFLLVFIFGYHSFLNHLYFVTSWVFLGLVLAYGVKTEN